MHKVLAVLSVMSMVLPLVDVIARPHQEIKPIAQEQLEQRSPACEGLLIVLRNGKKIQADSYTRREGQIDFVRKGKSQSIPTDDIKETRVIQGTCPSAVVKLKTGEKIEGYVRRQVCDIGCKNCRIEVSQKRGGVITIASSEIETLDHKKHISLVDRLIDIAWIPLYPVYGLLLFIASSL